MPNYHVKLNKPDGTVVYRTAYQNCGKNGFFYLQKGKRKSIPESDLISGKNPKRRSKRRTSRYRKCVRKDGKSGRPKGRRSRRSRRKSRSKSKKVMKKNCRKSCRKRHSRSKRKSKKCVKSCNKRYSRKKSKGSKKKSRRRSKKKSLPVMGRLPHFRDINRRNTSPPAMRGNSFNLGRAYNALPARRHTVPLNMQGNRPALPFLQRSPTPLNRAPSRLPSMNRVRTSPGNPFGRGSSSNSFSRHGSNSFNIPRREPSSNELLANIDWNYA